MPKQPAYANIYAALDQLWQAGEFVRLANGETAHGIRYPGNPPIFSLVTTYRRTVDLIVWAIREPDKDIPVFQVSGELRSNATARRTLSSADDQRFSCRYRPEPQRLITSAGTPGTYDQLGQPARTAAQAIVTAAATCKVVRCAECGRLRYYRHDADMAQIVTLMVAVRCGDTPLHFVAPVVLDLAGRWADKLAAKRLYQTSLHYRYYNQTGVKNKKRRTLTMSTGEVGPAGRAKLMADRPLMVGAIRIGYSYVSGGDALSETAPSRAVVAFYSHMAQRLGTHPGWRMGVTPGPSDMDFDGGFNWEATSFIAGEELGRVRVNCTFDQLRPHLPFTYASFSFDYQDDIETTGLAPLQAYLLLADMPAAAAPYVQISFRYRSSDSWQYLPLEEFLTLLETLWQDDITRAILEEDASDAA